MNKSIKLLTVKVCHLTQFSFLWSFYAQSGLVLFDKNNSCKSVACSYVMFRDHNSRHRFLDSQLISRKNKQKDKVSKTVDWTLFGTTVKNIFVC